MKPPASHVSNLEGLGGLLEGLAGRETLKRLKGLFRLWKDAVFAGLNFVFFLSPPLPPATSGPERKFR